MSKQGQSIQSHKHSFSGNTSTNGEHSHTFQVNNTNNTPGGFTTAYDSGQKVFDQRTSSSGIHNHSFSGITDEFGDSETKPANYTIRVWKRTA